MNLFKAIRIGMHVMLWYENASADGVITHQEIKELVTDTLDTQVGEIEIKV